MSKKNTKNAAKKSADSATKASEVEAEVGSAAPTETAEVAETTEETVAEAQTPVTVEELAKQLSEAQENYLRMAAELENVRRRAEKRISEAHQYALTDFALAIGEVRDCLEVAIETASDAPAGELDKMQEGVALTLRKLVAAMDARHILPIKPDVGVTFDPEIHMAIGQLPATAQAAADTVAAVVQAGYMLNGRIIRAANVMVAKAADETDKAKKTK
ncbi:MAG: nucleotide exchange factor GrpE [Proteobacteria bacterium]|nr:nucleotide exchange factor GrpE [Pseudomonadota bacterium]